MKPDMNMFGEKPILIEDHWFWQELDLKTVYSQLRYWLLLEAGLFFIGLIVVTLWIFLSPPRYPFFVPHRFPPPLAKPSSDFVDVAADYGYGFRRHMSPSLKILADGRYSYTSTGHESGWVKREGDDLTFASTDIEKFLTDRTLRPVRWGSRTYLIPHDLLGRFCDAILLGYEPRAEDAGRFLLDDGDKKVTGLPDLPEPWASYLRENIVLGTVIEASPDGRVRLDVGLAEGVHVGDVFTSPRDNSSEPWQWMVAFAGYDSCELEFIVAKADIGVTLDQTGVHPGRNLVMSRLLLSPELRWQ